MRRTYMDFFIYSIRVIKNRHTHIHESKQIKILRSRLLEKLKFRSTCHGLMLHNAAIVYTTDTKKILNVRRKIIVDFHIALLRVIGYCIRSIEFHDTAHVNGTCVNLLRKLRVLP